MDDKLELEGLAREIVNKVNMMRKGHDFEVTDRIKLSINKTDNIVRVFDSFGEYIKNETLSVDVDINDSVDGESVDLNGELVNILVVKRQ